MGEQDWRADLRAYKQDVIDAEKEHATAVRESKGTGIRASPDLWLTLNQEQRRELLRTGIDAVLLRRAPSTHTPLAERTEVLWVGEVDLDGSRRESAAVIRNRP